MTDSQPKRLKTTDRDVKHSKRGHSKTGNKQETKKKTEKES